MEARGMSLVKITRNRQITIPKELFDALDLQQGEYIEVTQEGDRIILRPKTVVDRERVTAKERLGKLLEEVWERNAGVDPELIEQEIAHAVSEVRKKRRTRKPARSKP